MLYYSLIRKALVLLLPGLFLLIFFAGCRQKVLRNSGQLQVEIKRNTSFKADKTVFLLVDTVTNTLNIDLTIQVPDKFPFPLGKELSDTLSNTAFRLCFISDGKPIISDYPNRNWDWHHPQHGETNFEWVSDTVDLKKEVKISTSMPLSAFYKLRKGKRRLELRVYQDVFTKKKYLNKGAEETEIWLKDSVRLVDFTIYFTVDIPEIYFAKVYGFGLTLKNDETFTPLGMDNTLWNSSYPDLYWAVLYPKGVWYTHTGIEKSTAEYTGLDTLNLYYYHGEDSVEIAVYDHDNLSRDDFLGSFKQQIYRIPQQRKSFSFGVVKQMDLSMERKGCINN